MKFHIVSFAALTFAASASGRSRSEFLQSANDLSTRSHDHHEEQEPTLSEQVGHALVNRGDDEPVRDAQGRTKEDTHVIWQEKSKYSMAVQLMFAGSWVLLLSSLPFIMPLVNGEMPSKTQFTVAGAMLVTIWGGFLLFTNIILFQSIHFERIRPLTVIECTYFMSQVITTVGYGDITPAKPRGQVFVGLYVLGALFIIAMVISDLTNRLVEKLEKRKPTGETAPAPAETQTVASLLRVKKPSVMPLLTAFGIFCVLDIMWVLFFSLHPGEEKTVFECIYMSIITLSTVGFGWFTPVTEEGMVFGSFMMLFGSGALVNVISHFTALMVDLNEYEKFKPENYKEAVATLEETAKEKGKVTESEFMRCILTKTKAVPAHVLEDIMAAWNDMKPAEGGVSLKKIVAIV
jgi:hypothetical protein